MSTTTRRSRSLVPFLTALLGMVCVAPAPGPTSNVSSSHTSTHSDSWRLPCSSYYTPGFANQASKHHRSVEGIALVAASQTARSDVIAGLLYRVAGAQRLRVLKDCLRCRSLFKWREENPPAIPRGEPPRADMILDYYSTAGNAVPLRRGRWWTLRRWYGLFLGPKAVMVVVVKASPKGLAATFGLVSLDAVHDFVDRELRRELVLGAECEAAGQGGKRSSSGGGGVVWSEINAKLPHSKRDTNPFHSKQVNLLTTSTR